MAENPRIEELRRRVQLDPASIAFAALAEEFRRMGRHDEAIETCRAGLQRHPAYLSARVTLGRALIETGDYVGARAEFETVLQSAPENLAATRGLAQINERLGHSTELDPHLAALMNAEVERIAESAATAPPPAPPPAAAPQPPPPAAAPEPASAPKAEPVFAAPPSAPARPEPAFDLENIFGAATFREPEPVVHVDVFAGHAASRSDAAANRSDAASRPAGEPMAAPGPDPAALAAVAGLERFLAAIAVARHA